jgi:hypothetical protein
MQYLEQLSSRARTAPGVTAVAVLLMMIGFPGAAPADTGLLVAPTRITLEPGQRSGHVYVTNNGNETVTIRISLVNKRMTPDGRLVSADNAVGGERFADTFLQYAPRRTTLAPGEGQTVRAMVRRDGNLAPGEYRSHLKFTVEPPSGTGRESGERNGDKGEDDITIRLTPIYGVTLPVIVRRGDLSASVDITDVSVDSASTSDAPLLRLKLQRGGNRSVYGDLRVTHRDRSGEERVVGLTRGVAVYTPLSERSVGIRLNRLGESRLRAGSLRVEYVENNGDSVFSTAEISLR